MKKASFSIIFFLVFSFLLPEPALGQSTEECNAKYPEINWMILDCSPGFATLHDRINIFARSGFDSSQPWQNNLNYSDSVWIFDAGAQGQANLVVDFHDEADGLVADLYDDGDGDGLVSYTIQETDLRVEENGGNWTVRVKPQEDWWEQNGVANFNLDLLVDGPPAMFFSAKVWGFDHLVSTDGVVDYEVYVRDPDQDGRPDYEWRQSRFPLPEDPRVSGQVRTEIIANTEDDEVPFQEGVFWSLLSRETGDYNKDRRGLPPIQVDWEKATIVQVAEFILARSDPGSYSIYSKQRVHEGKTNGTDFENPFAFYDLANAGDGFSDLNIRFGTIPPYYPETSFRNETPLNDIQYVWDQNHTQHWDYQVGLAGRQEIDEVIEFPEFSVRAVPHAKLPAWVTSQTWDMATFVQVEKPNYYNSEIVWEWSTSINSDAVRRKYLAGITDTPPVEDYAKLEAGLRGEYAFEYNSQPVLYFSLVDHKLHLLKAQAGIFQMEDQRTIRYQNLGGEYINLWTLLEEEQPVENLFFESGYLVYGNPTTVRMARPAAPAALFTTLPPINHEGWTELGAKLEQNKPTFAPDDFRAMLEQFGEANLSIIGAAVRDFRLLQDGFRFVLSLQEGFRLQGEDWLELKAREPGEYAVRYDDSFHLEPLTPPALSFEELGEQVESVTQYTTSGIPVKLWNDGLEDAKSVIMTATFTTPALSFTEPLTRTTSVPTGEYRAFSFPLTPREPGTWRLQLAAQLIDDEGRPGEIFSATQEIQVAPALEVTRDQALSAFGLAPGWAVVLLLASAALAAVCLAWSLRQEAES